MDQNQELVNTWLTWLGDVKNRAPSTLRVYTSLMDTYVTHLGDDDILRVTVPEMEQFASRPRLRGRHRDAVGAPASRSRDCAILRSFYGWCWRNGYTATDVALGLSGPTVHNRNPRPIPDEHWVGITSHLRPHDMGQNARERALVMLCLGFWCGLRRIELVGLRARHVDGERLRDFVRKGGGEHTLDIGAICNVMCSRLSHLTQPMDEFWLALEVLADAPPETPLLGLSGVDAVNRAFKRQCDLLEFEYTPHQLRHSAITNWLRAGVPLHLASQMAHHSSPEMTMRYVRAGGDELREWLDATNQGIQQETNQWRTNTT